MDEHDWLAERFEEYRPHLRAVAYRVLGSASEADDAVQEAWLRFSRSGADGVENLGGWLTTIVARVSLNMLQARRSRREEPMEPPAIDQAEAGGTSPEYEAVLADSVGLALLVVLDTLSPAERLAFVLHDMFAVPFDEIAPIVGRTPDTARQLASRARRRLRGAPEPDADLPAQRRAVDAFLAASRGGDFAALLDVLDPDVIFRADTGGRRGLVVAPRIDGAEAVARYAVAEGSRWARWCRPAMVNGSWGYVVATPRRPIGVVGVTVTAGKITTIDLVLDPAKVPSQEAINRHRKKFS
jgi:RNA polymerase sigma factor (sigma-70 family)